MRGRYLIRVAVPVAATIGVAAAIALAAGSARAGQSRTPAPVAVDVGPNGQLIFSPSVATVKLGGSAKWTWRSSPHSSTDADGTLALWDSGVQSSGFTFSHTFTAAATYDYHCSVHFASGMVGQVKVRPLVSPKTGSTSTPITVTWATAPPPSGDQYDLQELKPGTTTWVSLAHNNQGMSLTTMLPTTGTWKFRTRIHHPGGSATKWSPGVPVTIS